MGLRAGNLGLVRLGWCLFSILQFAMLTIPTDNLGCFDAFQWAEVR